MRETGEALPDTLLLPELAEVLDTTVDLILRGGEKAMTYRGKVTVAHLAEGLRALKRMGECLGRDNLLYRSAVEGINTTMNTDIEAAFVDERVFECFVAEASIQCLLAGKYIDLTDVQKSFAHEPYRSIVLERCKRCGIK